jgi:hypothetical protein
MSICARISFCSFEFIIPKKSFKLVKQSRTAKAIRPAKHRFSLEKGHRTSAPQILFYHKIKPLSMVLALFNCGTENN